MSTEPAAGQQSAEDAFAAFLANTSATVSQIEFVNMIIDHLTERGSVEPLLLYESPFTDIDPMGMEGIFEQREAVEVVSILAEIQRRAAA